MKTMFGDVADDWPQKIARIAKRTGRELLMTG